MARNKPQKKPLPKKARSAFVFEELEPRLLLSADFPIDLAGAFAPEQEEEQPLSIYQDVIASSLTEETQTPHELVFVDTDTPDYQQLVDDLLENSSENRSFEVVLLDNDGDGITQITQVLSEYSELVAVHLISHGSEGSIDLGGTLLDADTLNENSSSIQQWAQAFSDEGDLLIYGCNLAENEAGKTLVNSLANLTGADVAASDDLTGSALFGGDWDLEYRVGDIESEIALSASAQSTWSGTLAAALDTTSNGSTTGSSITISHTTSGSERLMLVGISMDRESGDSVTSVTYNGIGNALSLVGVIDDGDGNVRVEIWKITAPDTGTHDVVVSFSGAVTGGAIAGVSTFTGVDQASSLGAFASAGSPVSTTSTSASVNVGAAVGDLVFSTVGLDGSTNVALNVGAGQTEHWETYQVETDGAGSTKIATSTSETVSWTFSANQWAIAGVAIKPHINTAPTNVTLSQATSVTIANPGFESQTISDGGELSTITSWTNTGDSGVWNPPGTNYTSEAPEGDNVGFIDTADTISQTLSENFIAGRSYSLSAMVGDEKQAGDSSGWEMRLYAGSQLLGSVSNSDFDPGDDSFIKATLHLDADTLATYSAEYGQALKIEFYDDGSAANVHFDDVQLEYTAISVAEAAANGTVVADVSSVY